MKTIKSFLIYKFEKIDNINAYFVYGSNNNPYLIFLKRYEKFPYKKGNLITLILDVDDTVDKIIRK